MLRISLVIFFLSQAGKFVWFVEVQLRGDRKAQLPFPAIALRMRLVGSPRRDEAAFRAIGTQTQTTSFDRRTDGSFSGMPVPDGKP